MKGDTQAAVLKRYLIERGWPSRVVTYDRYGTEPICVELRPHPTAEQLADLQEHFGTTFHFTTVVASQE